MHVKHRVPSVPGLTLSDVVKDLGGPGKVILIIIGLLAIYFTIAGAKAIVEAIKGEKNKTPTTRKPKASAEPKPPGKGCKVRVNPNPRPKWKNGGWEKPK